MPTPAWWKEYYVAERSALGRPALAQLVHDAPSIEFPERGAIIFPHTRLAASGYLTAAAAKAVIHSGCETVLALGVLHGVARDRTDLHGIHFEDELTRNEFSLDNFEVLLRLSAEDSGMPMPRYVPAYPVFRQPGAMEPQAMPGFSTLRSLIADGAALVATADMVHHGAAYGTPPRERLDRESDAAHDYSRRAIAEQFAALLDRNYDEFLKACDDAHSDFRDVGPMLASLLTSPGPATVLDLTLVNYADVLRAEEPTWVAAALATFAIH